MFSCEQENITYTPRQKLRTTYINLYQLKHKQMTPNVDYVTFYVIFLQIVFDNQISFVHEFLMLHAHKEGYPHFQKSESVIFNLKCL